ncbi:MAG TPA: FAD-dependent oxidoreductase [Candidatus Dormibacteraeota bacterium]|jgi:thioredoxin reductase (NADPH)|nr:FAD-dependent oxidoreductase [Candidatus Dormibacteraeota bacterium]
MAEDAVSFPVLDESDMATLDAVGTRRATSTGEYLFREGDTDYDFHVVVAGAVEIVLGSNDKEQVITRHGAGRFLGELNMLTGRRAYLSARVVEPGEVIVLSRTALRQLMATHPHLGDIILGAFVARRTGLLADAAAATRIVGSRYLPETRRLREFLTRNRIPHQWLDPDRDGEAVEQLLRDIDVAADELPVVISSGTVLRRPTPGVLADFLGLTLASLPERCFDLVVLGAGPAGLAAAVYGASEGLSTLLAEKVAAGGQAGASSRIENYLGFPMGISGGDLTFAAVVQAEKFGAHLTLPCAAASLREEAGHLVIRLSDGSDIAGRAVIVASGARYRRLEVDRLEDFEGNGVYYAATELEARACAAEPVVIVGGGNSAGQAALFLAESGSPVTVVIRAPSLDRSMSRYLVERIEADGRITVRRATRVTALDGDQTLRSVRVSSGGDDAVALRCAALFSFIGAEPSSGWLSGCVSLDSKGFILTDRSLDEEHLGRRWEVLGRRPLPFETSMPGLFAVGDVRSGSMKRVASAVGEGSAAVRSVHEFLDFAH